MNQRNHALKDNLQVCLPNCPCIVKLLRKVFDSNSSSEPCETSQYRIVDLPGVTKLDRLGSGDHRGIMTSFITEDTILSIRDDTAAQCILSGVDSFDLNKEEEKYDFDLEDGKKEEEQIPDQQLLTGTSQVVIREEEALKAIKPCVQYERKRCELLRTLTRDLKIIDFKISLFITACNNVRLIPYPEHIVEETPEGLHGLTQINDFIPPVKFLKTFLERRQSLQLQDQVVNLVHWLTVLLRQPKLVELLPENYESVFQRIEYVVNIHNPDYMFKIVVNNLSSNHLQWQASRGKHSTKFAFYPARVEHLHSLIHLGLYPFQKVAGLMGTGIYLTSDLKRCLETSPPAWVWGKSIIGTQLQTVVVVEFIASNPKVVAYRDKSAREAQYCKPYHYFVPLNNLIQARYILVFVRDTHQIPIETLEFLSKQTETKLSWNRILLFGSYLAICFLSWKTLRTTYNANIWQTLANKFEKIPYLKPVVFFLQQQPEFLNCMAQYK